MLPGQVEEGAWAAVVCPQFAEGLAWVLPGSLALCEGISPYYMELRNGASFNPPAFARGKKSDTWSELATE